MDLALDPTGSYTAPDDPGEPSNGHRRLSVTDHEGLLLAELARDRNVLEIGTGLGVSTRYLNRTARVLVTLDIDPWVQREIWPNLGSTIVKHTERLPGQYTMVFIDGSHREEDFLNDLEYARSVCPTGIIVAHDSMELARHIPPDWFHVQTQHGLAIGVTR